MDREEELEILELNPKLEEILFLIPDFDDYVGSLLMFKPSTNIIIPDEAVKELLEIQPNVKELLRFLNFESTIEDLIDFRKIQEAFDNERVIVERGLVMFQLGDVYLYFPFDPAKKRLFAYAITLSSNPSNKQIEIYMDLLKRKMPPTPDQLIQIFENWNKWPILQILNLCKLSQDTLRKVIGIISDEALLEIGLKVFRTDSSHYLFFDLLVVTQFRLIHREPMYKFAFPMIRNCVTAYSKFNQEEVDVHGFVIDFVMHFVNKIEEVTGHLLTFLVIPQEVEWARTALLQLEKLVDEFSKYNLLIDLIFDYDIAAISTDFYNALKNLK